MEDKVRENRLRRAAKRQDFILVRSRRRDERSTAYGLYAVIDPNTGGTVNPCGPNDIHTWTLDEVEQYLTS